MAIDYTGFKFQKTGVTPKKAKDTRNRAGRKAAAADRDVNVFPRQRFVCYAKGISPVCTGGTDHPHELIPVSKGGPRESWNRVGVCAACHAATDSTLGGRRLYFTWPGKGEGKQPNADKPFHVTAFWRDRKTRKTAPGSPPGVLTQDGGGGRPITQPATVIPVESSTEGKNP